MSERFLLHYSMASFYSSIFSTFFVILSFGAGRGTIARRTCFFNIFICHLGPCDQFLDLFRGSCCVKITKNSSKSTFPKLFDLIMTGNFVYFFSFEICYVDCFFNVFICHSGTCDPFLDPFRVWK